MEHEAGKHKILIIDDDEEICLITKRILERTGQFEVEYSLSGKHGLDLALASRPELVLLDILMPDMDGSTVAAQIQQIPALSNTHIIFLSALVQGNEVKETQGVIGGYEFISKPVDTRGLVARVCAAVS